VIDELGLDLLNLAIRWRKSIMRMLKPLLSVLLFLGLAGCFVQHAEPIGVPEPVKAGALSGLWVAEPRRPGEEIGFFAVTDIDPDTGRFAVAEADGDGNPIEEPTTLLLRRVGDTLFLDAQETTGEPWRLFVVASMAPGRIELAWVPRAEAFRQAFSSGELAGSESPGAPQAPTDIVLDDLTADRQIAFARNWQSLFTPERLVLVQARAE